MVGCRRTIDIYVGSSGAAQPFSIWNHRLPVFGIYRLNNTSKYMNISELYAKFGDRSQGTDYAYNALA